MRAQLKILKDFICSFDFTRMTPENSVIRGGVSAGDKLEYIWKGVGSSDFMIKGEPRDPRAWALVEQGMAYAIYINGGDRVNLILDVPAGQYRAEWLNPHTGEMKQAQLVAHAGGDLSLASPAYIEDIALRLTSTSYKQKGMADRRPNLQGQLREGSQPFQGAKDRARCSD